MAKFRWTKKCTALNSFFLCIAKETGWCVDIHSAGNKEKSLFGDSNHCYVEQLLCLNTVAYPSEKRAYTVHNMYVFPHTNSL